MCGILFYIAAQQIQAEHPALAALRRRGPDGFQHSSHGPFHVAFSRLAVISSAGTSGRVSEWTSTVDSAGMQPLWNGSVGVLCNGEIFNYKEIAHQNKTSLESLRSDIDLLTRLPLDGAAEWLPRLNGDFAGVLFGTEPERFLLFRDPMGIRPLYIGRDASSGKIIAAGSLMTTVAAVPGVVEIMEFPPGHYYDSNVGVIQRYTADMPPAGQITDAGLAQEAIYEQLYAAVRRRLLHSNVPVAFLCSGGLDSSILLTIGHHIWTSELHQPASALHAYSIEFMDDRGSSTSQDTFYANFLTKALGVSHTVFSFTRSDIEEHLDNILATVETDDHRTLRAAIPQYFLGRAIKMHTPHRVILSGEGADELFLGYNYMSRCPGPKEAEAESRRLVANIHRFDVLRAERAMSAWGLELRVPYLDPRFVRLVQSISGSLRNTPTEKELLRASFATEAVLRDTRILDRGKEKFSDGCGFDYVPTLMRLLTARAGGDATRSAHLLENDEKTYVRADFARRFLGFNTASNSEFREMPDWIDIPKPVINSWDDNSISLHETREWAPGEIEAMMEIAIKRGQSVVDKTGLTDEVDQIQIVSDVATPIYEPLNFFSEQQELPDALRPQSTRIQINDYVPATTTFEYEDLIPVSTKIDDLTQGY